MKYENTQIKDARWSEFAQQNWGDWDFIWEEANLDYQGDARFLATKDGRFVYCEWSYGSCSGCDAWEGLSEEEAKADFDKHAVYFNNGEELVKFAKQVNYGKEFTRAVMTYIFEEEVLKK